MKKVFIQITRGDRDSIFLVGYTTNLKGYLLQLLDILDRDAYNKMADDASEITIEHAGHQRGVRYWTEDITENETCFYKKV